MADCVITLDNRVTNQITTRRLRIVKYRGSFHGNNEYPFIIDEKGITVFPIISEAHPARIKFRKEYRQALKTSTTCWIKKAFTREAVF